MPQCRPSQNSALGGSVITPPTPSQLSHNDFHLRNYHGLLHDRYDPSSEKYYFWDNITGEVTWDTPANYLLASDDITIRSVVRLQCCYRSKKARQATTEAAFQRLKVSSRLSPGAVEITRIIKRIGRREEMKAIDFRGFQMNDMQLQRASQALMNNRSVEEINFSGNLIGDAGLLHFAKVLGSRSLNIIHISALSFPFPIYLSLSIYLSIYISALSISLSLSLSIFLSLPPSLPPTHPPLFLSLLFPLLSSILPIGSKYSQFQNLHRSEVERERGC
jgi:hypothetical protein